MKSKKSYSLYNEYLSGEDSKDRKLGEVKDIMADLKAQFAIDMQAHEVKGLPDDDSAVLNTKKEYNREWDALMKSSIDNNVLEKKEDSSLEVGKKDYESAIKRMSYELKLKRLGRDEEMRLEKEEKRRKRDETDEYLSNQQQSEPMDIFDPDG